MTGCHQVQEHIRRLYEHVVVVSPHADSDNTMHGQCLHHMFWIKIYARTQNTYQLRGMFTLPSLAENDLLNLEPNRCCVGDSQEEDRVLAQILYAKYMA